MGTDISPNAQHLVPQDNVFQEIATGTLSKGSKGDNSSDLPASSVHPISSANSVLHEVAAVVAAASGHVSDQAPDAHPHPNPITFVHFKPTLKGKEQPQQNCPPSMPTDVGPVPPLPTSTLGLLEAQVRSLEEKLAALPLPTAGGSDPGGKPLHQRPPWDSQLDTAGGEGSSIPWWLRGEESRVGHDAGVVKSLEVGTSAGASAGPAASAADQAAARDGTSGPAVVNVVALLDSLPSYSASLPTALLSHIKPATFPRVTARTVHRSIGDDHLTPLQEDGENFGADDPELKRLISAVSKVIHWRQ